jgi:DNA-binding transcriptional regulator YdaS (Cro superfamily)
VCIRKDELNHQTGGVETMSGRRWIIEKNATEGEVVRTLLKAALTWEEHELRERFRLDGRLVGNPHFHVPGEPRPDRT